MSNGDQQIEELPVLAPGDETVDDLLVVVDTDDLTDDPGGTTKQLSMQGIITLVERDGNVGIKQYTAAEAAALPITDGLMIYVTSIDITTPFDQVGFWGTEQNSWVKL